MKLSTIFTALLFSIISFTLFAQPVLDYGDNYYTLGDVITTELVNPTGFDEGPDGANQTWDYSSLAITGQTLINEVIEPSGTNAGGSFTTSNIALTDDNAGMITYFIQNDNEFVFTGSAIDMINQVIAFDNNQTLFTWPFTMGSEVSDTYSADYVNSGFPATQTGEMTTTSVGYGTITLPNSTVVENALKIRREQSTINTITISENNESVSEVIISSVFWMTPSTSRAVLIHTETNFIINGVPQDPSFQVQMIDPGDVGVSNFETSNLADINIYPNPSTDIVNVIFTSNESEDYQIRIYTSEGRLVKESSGLRSSNINSIIEIPISSLSRGLYLVELTIGGSYKVKRVFVKS